MDGFWTLILAAGASKRFGAVKALAPLQNGNFLTRTIGLARGFSEDRFRIVTGASADKIRAAIPHGHEIHHPDWRGGMGTSLAQGMAGILRCDPETEAVLVLTIDQPFVTGAHLEKLRRKFLETGKTVLSSADAVHGPPSIVSRGDMALVALLKDDRGLKSALVDFAIVEAGNILVDIDDAETYRALIGPSVKRTE
jgi:molybdenum cofactor cytidylyltransferase